MRKKNRKVDTFYRVRVSRRSIIRRLSGSRFYNTHGGSLSRLLSESGTSRAALILSVSVVGCALGRAARRN